MENNKTKMVCVPLSEYKEGIEAKIRLEIIEKFALSSRFGPDRHELFKILGTVVPKPKSDAVYFAGGNEDVHGNIPGTGERSQ